MNSIRGMTSSLAYFIAWHAKLLIWCLTICCYYCLVAKLYQLFAIPWSVALQVLLSMGFLRQEYWSGLPCPSPGDLPDPGIKSVSPVSPALQADSLLLSHQGYQFVINYNDGKNELFIWILDRVFKVNIRWWTI